MAVEQFGHLFGGLEIALGVGKGAIAELAEGAAVAGGGEDVLQVAAIADVVMDVIGGDEREAGLAGEGEQFAETAGVVGTEVEFGEEVRAVAEDGAD
jgi:hypothetical protein